MTKDDNLEAGKAEREARDLDFLDGGAITLQVRPGKKYWRASWRKHGRLINRSTGIPHRCETPGAFEESRRLALMSAKLMRAKDLSFAQPQMTIRAYLENCLRQSRGSRVEVLKLFLAALGDTGNDLLVEFSRDHQRRYMLARGEDLGYTTLIKETNHLWHVFQYAVDCGVLAYNPIELSDLESWYLRDGLTELQLKALFFAATHIEWRTAVYLGYYAGAVLQQAMTLDWTVVREEADGRMFLTLPGAKHVRERLVQVHPMLHSHFDAIYRREGRVCPALAKLELRAAENQFSKIVLSASLPDGVTFGSLKRTYAALLGVHINRVDSSPPESAMKVPGIDVPPLECQNGPRRPRTDQSPGIG